MVKARGQVDWAAVPPKDIAIKIARKLAEHDPRWHGYPRELMHAKVKAWKNLTNVVEYQLQLLRAPTPSP